METSPQMLSYYSCYLSIIIFTVIYSALNTTLYSFLHPKLFLRIHYYNHLQNALFILYHCYCCFQHALCCLRWPYCRSPSVRCCSCWNCSSDSPLAANWNQWALFFLNHWILLTLAATASDCATQCRGNTSCLSFLFGLVDGVDKCILYSVPASSLPPQTNLVAYDIACTSIPSVVPTAANPGGLRTRQAQGTHANPLNEVPEGSPAPIDTPKVDDLAACLDACKGNPSCIAYTFESGVCKLFGPTNTKRAEGDAGNAAQDSASSSDGTVLKTAVATHEAPLNAVPEGSPAPIDTPKVDDLAACLAACKGNPSCVAYTFESGVCKLFN